MKRLVGKGSREKSPLTSVQYFAADQPALGTNELSKIVFNVI
jgi:hypothetical protein